jgi:hypothetical protein
MRCCGSYATGRSVARGMSPPRLWIRSLHRVGDGSSRQCMRALRRCAGLPHFRGRIDSSERGGIHRNARYGQGDFRCRINPRAASRAMACRGVRIGWPALWRSATMASTRTHAPLQTASVFNRRERTPLTSDPFPLGKHLLCVLLEHAHRADVRDGTVADAGDVELGQSVI